MRYRAAATPPGGLALFLCTAIVMVVCVGLFALPAAAQQSPLAGTPAQGTNPDSPSSPPDLVTIAAEGCTVSEGASITLEDGDGTAALFVDGQLGIEITSVGGQIRIEGPDDDYIGDHAFSTSDPGFDTDGDYVVSTTTRIACQSGGTTSGPDDEPPDTRDLTTAADDQYDATTGDTTTTAKDGIINDKKIIDIPKQKVLVDTGGPPLLLLGAALLCLAGAGGAAIAIRVLRR